MPCWPWMWQVGLLAGQSGERRKIGRLAGFLSLREAGEAIPILVRTWMGVASPAELAMTATSGLTDDGN